MSESVKGKRLIPLAVLSDKPVVLEGYGELPPVTKWLPTMPAPMNYFGIWCAKGTPENVVRTMTMAWDKKIKSSEALKKYATARSALFTPIHGAEAETKSSKWFATRDGCTSTPGKGKVSPRHGRHPKALSRRRLEFWATGAPTPAWCAMAPLARFRSLPRM